MSTVDGQDLYRCKYRVLGFDSCLELRIYEARLLLADLMADIIKLSTERNDIMDQDNYFSMARLDKRLGDWYESLSDVLKWTASNITHAPRSFFVLQLVLDHFSTVIFLRWHPSSQQYHATLILLHRPFIEYEKIRHLEEPDFNSNDEDCFNISKKVCLDNAVRIAAIFKQFQDKFNTGDFVSVRLYPLVTAATILIERTSECGGDKASREERSRLQYIIQGLRQLDIVYPVFDKIFGPIETTIGDSTNASESLSGKD